MLRRFALLIAALLLPLLTAPVARAQQMPEMPLPGPGPHEERHFIPQPFETPRPEQASPRVVDTRTLYFDFRRAELKPEAEAALTELVQVLQADSRATVRLEGHTDAVGGAEYNLKLAEARADTVGKYLMSRGIEAERILTVGLGRTEPVADNATEEGRAMNRRVDISIVSGSPMAALR